LAVFPLGAQDSEDLVRETGETVRIALHELHQRRLEVMVELVDNALDRVERLVEKARREGIIKTVQNPFSLPERDRLLAKSRELRAELREFASRFGLRRHEADLRQILNAELSSMWVMLENCRPKRLKGYGQPFSPEAWEALEESIERLTAMVSALREGLR